MSSKPSKCRFALCFFVDVISKTTLIPSLDTFVPQFSGVRVVFFDELKK